MTKLLFTISVFIIVFSGALFVFARIYSTITPLPQVRPFTFLDNNPLTSYSFTATMLSVTALIIYASVVLYMMTEYFENTQSSEIIFIAFFLAGCLCEAVRFFIPLFGGLWKSYSSLLLFTGRIIYLGRTAAVVYLLGSAIMSDQTYRQDIERNLTLLGLISIVTALILPLNTGLITSTAFIPCGFYKLYCIIRGIIIAITFLSFILNSFNHDTPEYRLLALHYIIIITGYYTLLITDNYLFLAAGLILISIGTYNFLHNLHKLYMWK